jgi:hypothetical protein
MPRFEFEAPCVPLPSLKRLEFWQNYDAERSGGINSLYSLLRHAPNVEYLVIGGMTGLIVIGLDPHPVHLANLRTLRLEAINSVLLRQISRRWSMPSLTCLIIDYPHIHTDEGMHDLWEAYGAQLVTVEFGRHVRFLMSDFITPCIQGCPNLQDFSYYLFFTLVPTPSLHPSISTIRLSLLDNPMLDTEPTCIWDIAEKHFDKFQDGSYPSLKTVQLFLPPRSSFSVTDLRFISLENSLLQKDMRVEIYDL